MSMAKISRISGGRRIRPTGASLMALTAALLAGGCAVGPDFEKPATPKVNGYTPEPLAAQTVSADVAGGAAQRLTTGVDIPAQWWTQFHSEPLNTLVDESLKSNPSVAAAQASLRGAMENVFAQEGAFFPSINANFTPTRYHNAVQPSPTLNSYVSYFNLYAAQIGASWTLDIWGGNRRAVEALQATADSQRFQLEATYLTLTSSVVAAAVQEASLRGQIAATQDIVKVETESLGILHKQLSLGQVAGVDVAAQEATLAQAQAALEPLSKQLALQRDLLTALAGHLPSEEVEQHFDLAGLELPEDVPVSIPSKLMEQRPDILAAAESLHAASAQIGVAIANMLPNITITAADGTTATHLSELFKPFNGYWSVAGGVTQPIFQGGTLLHKTRAARANFDQATAQYQSTVISAFQNVADTLRSLQSDARALKANLAAEKAASESLELTRKQLQLGAVGYLALLTAEQTYQQAVVNRVQAQAARFADTALLFEAMGGGWWNRKDVDVADGGTAVADH